MVNAHDTAKPLLKRRIVVTRAREQASELVAYLERLGATVISLPAIAIAPPAKLDALDLVIRSLADYSGFIFTSANSVRALCDRAHHLHIDLVRPPSSWVCTVGPATAAALTSAAGAAWQADITPDDYVAESLLRALENRELRGGRILLPRGSLARDLVPEELSRRGAIVTAVEAYRTVLPRGSKAEARRLIAAPLRADAVLFTSSSTARNFVALLGVDYRARLNGMVLAAIGPVTRTALAELGLQTEVEAPQHTAAGLVNALVKYWDR